MHFLKKDLQHFGGFKLLFVPGFEAVVTHFDPLTYQKTLSKG